MSKIALVSNTGWSLYNFRRNLMNALTEQGHQVIAVSPSDDYTDKLPVRHVPVEISRKGTNPLGEIRLMKDLAALYGNEKVDAVLHFTTKPNIWGTLAAARASRGTGRIAVINNIAGLGIVFAKKGLVRLILENLYRISQRKADRIFFQNPDDYSLFEGAGLVPVDKIDLLPGSGVDLEKFSFSPLEDKPDGELVFIMSARLLKEKGVVQYVEAAERIKRRYPKVSYFLLGRTDPGNRTSVSQEELEHWVGEGIIHWIPWSDNVEELLRKSDCVVLPSYYREGTPRSLLEGMALGRPLIAADSPGCRETVVPGKNGYLVTPRSVESLEAAMGEFIGLGNDQRQLMSRESRSLAEKKYNEKIVIRRYINTLDALLKEEI